MSDLLNNVLRVQQLVRGARRERLLSLLLHLSAELEVVCTRHRRNNRVAVGRAGVRSAPGFGGEGGEGVVLEVGDGLSCGRLEEESSFVGFEEDRVDFVGYSGGGWDVL